MLRNDIIACGLATQVEKTASIIINDFTRREFAMLAAGGGLLSAARKQNPLSHGDARWQVGKEVGISWRRPRQGADQDVLLCPVWRP